MGGNEALREVLLEITSDKTSLEKLKWSVGVSLRWIISQLHSLDKYKVMELMHKSSEECFDLAIKILESQGNPVALKAPEAKAISENIWNMFLHVQSLTWDKYNKFVSSMGDKLEQIWKCRLDAADQSQTVQLVETLFHQDPIAFSLILEEMCALELIQKSAGAKGAGGASEAFGKLSDTDLDKLRPYLKYYLPHISSHELEKTGGDGIVGLMEKNAHLSCKEMMEKVLKRMDRTDLVWRLSLPSEQQDPPSDQRNWLCVMAQKIWSDFEKLLVWSETSLQHYEKTLPLLLKERAPPAGLKREYTVLSVFVQHGLQTLYKVALVLSNMGLRDQAKSLIHSHHQPRSPFSRRYRPCLYKATKDLVYRELLLDTVYELSFTEMSHYEWFVQFTFLQQNVSWTELECERQREESEIMTSAGRPLTTREACAALMKAAVGLHGRHAGTLMKSVFKNMNRGDPVRKPWSYLSVRNLFKSEDGLNVTIKEMEALINSLMHTLRGLSVSELMDLKHALSTSEHSDTLRDQLYHYDNSHLVFSMVQTHGKGSVELTKNFLESIGRKNLLPQLTSEAREHSKDLLWCALINKVATVAAVIELFGETLSLLRPEELKQLKKLFVLRTLFHPQPHVDMKVLVQATARQTGALLLHMYGFEALRKTYWILMEMKCSHAAQKLESMMTSSPTKVMKREATVKNLREHLFKLLARLSREELYEFKWWFQLEYCRMNRAWIQELETDVNNLIDHIFETSDMWNLSAIERVLFEMGRGYLNVGIYGTSQQWFLEYTITEESFHKKNPKVSKHLKQVQRQLTDELKTQTFRKHLQTYCENYLSRRFVRDYIEIFPDTRDLVELLEALYGESWCNNIIDTVLKDVGRLDESTFSSKGVGPSVEPDSCTSAKDSWTKLEPKVKEIKNRSIYSLQSDMGQYECSVSGLRWSCEEKVSFDFKFGLWEEHMERVQALQYMPAGPLIDVTVTSGRLDEVYLPHWVCVDDPDLAEEFAVLHVDDCGDIVEKATTVTSTHVKLKEPIFSLRAVLIRLGRKVKVFCNILIYKTNTAFLTLHVYLIPRDPGLVESLNTKEKKHGYSIVPKPDPDESLKLKTQFVLKAEPETVEICPQKLKLRHQRSPNFFEVYTKNPEFDLNLELAQEQERSVVWSCTIRRDEYTEGTLAAPQTQGIHFVDKFESELIQRVSNVAEILDRPKSERVISDEAYDKIRQKPIDQEKMRELFRGPLRSSGDRGKEIFYTILKDIETYLCKDLQKLQI